MADETKTYLVNVESNLDKYIAEAAKAKKNVDDLTAANNELNKSGTATTEEIESSNAQLRNAQKEYKEAKRLVDLQTTANNSNVNSRKQLASIVEIEQKRLGSLANQYTINEKGQKVLSQAYLDGVKKVKDAKDAIIAYDKAQSDGRSSVGLYSEALQGALGKFERLPGPIGTAAAATSKFGTTLKALAITGVTIAITAIAGAVTLLVKAFKGNDEASEKFAGVMKGIGLSIKEVLGRIVSLGKSIGELFKGNFAEAANLAKEAVTGFGSSLKNAYGAGIKAQEVLNQIEDDEIALLEKRAQRERDIAELKKKSRNEAEGSVKQAEYLRKADELITANLKDELALQQKRVDYAQIILDNTNNNQVTDEMRRNLAEEKAKMMELETQALNEQGGLMKRLNSLEKESTKDKEAALTAIEKQKAELQKELEDYHKSIADQKKADAEAIEDKKQKDIEYAEWKREQEVINAENLLQIQEYNNENEFSIRRQRLEEEHQKELEMAEKSGADKNIINQKYTAAGIELAKQEQDAKIAIYEGFSSSIATLFGENTALGRIAAVVSTTISTYRGAMAAFAETPGGVIIKSMAAATAVATGIASVKKILSTKSNLPGDKSGGSSSMPTAITTSTPTQFNYATAAGATTITQPTLSQSQVNALPNQQALSADDIANAISKLPAPKVSVEDINAKINAVNKVEVRATI